MLPRIIVQQLDGAPANNAINTENSAIDQGNSHIYGTSVFANYIEGVRDQRAKNTGCDLYLMSSTEQQQNSDTTHLRLYKEDGKLVYYIEGHPYTLEDRAFGDETVGKLFNMANLKKNGVLARNQLNPDQKQACQDLLAETLKRGHTQRTEDKTVIGYTLQGLPFLIVVDGFYGGATAATFAFIDNFVTPLMAEYSQLLSASQDATGLLKKLIHTIYQLREQHAGAAEFTLSLAIVYEKEGQQFCAGFGIGDVGLVLRRKEPRELIQLAHNTKADNSKDAFDYRASQQKDRDKIIERNSTFNVAIHPGDELLGYTHLCKMETEEKVSSFGKAEVHQYGLSTDQPFNAEQSLYDQVIERNKQNFAEQCRVAEESKKTERFGDDCMISSVIAPSLAVQRHIQGAILAATGDEKKFLAALAAILQENSIKRVDILDLFNKIKVPQGPYAFLHHQKNPRWDKVRLFFKATCNLGEDHFWHTAPYQKAVKLLKKAYLARKTDRSDENRQDEANRFIDYVRGNAPIHSKKTETRKNLLK